ncbi:hypothetical protein L9F63_003424 [Diploptera punctata]|uniref:G-protein coupled receptors family 1 profile domain-containing protein n=1 Tax=Diploptera punctata TaxID=6984 RepID=A0AAD8E9H7_DIPPU|nr:hypothetical protein L9F63_003424 [Diploptera punctata]
MKFVTIIISLSVVIQLCSSNSEVPKEEYDKLILDLETIVDQSEMLNKLHNSIDEMCYGTQIPKSAELKENCTLYVSQRKIYIDNVTQINNFVDKYNLTAFKSELMHHPFLNVPKLRESLNTTDLLCSICKRKLVLNESLEQLNNLNRKANSFSNKKVDNSTIKFSDLRNKAIPKKETILEKIINCTSEVYSINELCNNNNLTKICNSNILNISYWLELRNNITDDLTKLKETVFVYLTINYVQPILYIAVFISGFFGNTILLIIFFRNEKIRKPQNMIIFNLALADTLSLICNLPLNYVFEKISLTEEGTFLPAQIFHFSRILCLGLSAFSTVALCLQRFSATLKASNYIGFILRQSSKDSATKVIASIWISAIIFAIPRAVHGDIYIYEKFNSRKTMYEVPIQIVTTVELMCFSITPFIIISILSWYTVRHFQERAEKIPADIPELNKTYQLEMLSRSTKVIMLSPIIFACTSLPFFFFYSLRNFFQLDINSPRDTLLKVITNTLLFLSCSFNPIGLYMASGNFRRCTRQIFGLGPCKKSLKYAQRERQQLRLASSENETLDTYL